MKTQKCKSRLFIIAIVFFSICNSNTNFASEPGEQENYKKSSIEKVLAYSIDEYGINITCTANGNVDTIYVNISFPFTDALRFQLSHGTRKIVLEKSEKYQAEETSEFIKFFTPKISLLIDKNSYQISVKRDDIHLFSQDLFLLKSTDKIKFSIITEMSRDEHFYGFGEKFNGLDQRGKNVVMELDDAYMSENHQTYKSIPFFISSKKYGLLVNSTKRVVFNMGNLKESEYDFENPAPSIDYYIFSNENPLEIMKQYTSISGRSPLVPKWSLEPWLSRRRMTGWNLPKKAEADIDMIINHGFRLGVILWEGIRVMFEVPRQSDMLKLSNKWHEMGLKQVSWDYSGHIHKDIPIIQSVKNDYFLRFNDGTFCIGHRNKSNVYINPTDKEAMDWWIKNLYEVRFLNKDGLSSPNAWNLDGVKIDFCELFPKNDESLLNVDNSIGMHNYHAVSFSEQIYNWLQTVKPDGGITWVRGGGLGLQKVGFAWGGDRGRTFDQLRGTVVASLGVSVCGVSLIGHDLGGYRGGNSLTERKVFIRGVQYATFSPSFHDHGSAPAPWEQNEYGIDNYSFYSRVRYNILPYLYHHVKVSHDTGIPLMRTLFMHHPNDINTYSIEDEYYLGENLIVAPILTEVNERKVYLPEGRWIDFWNHSKFDGHDTINFKSELNRIPVFVKEGTILPLELNDEMEIGGLFPHDQKNKLLLSFRIFEGPQSKLELFHNLNNIEITKSNIGGRIVAEVNNIKQNFGLLFDGVNPKKVFVNGKELINLNPQQFSNAIAGWIYNQKFNQLMIKMKYQSEESNYKVEIEDFINYEPSYNNLELTKLNEPIIKRIDGWENAADISFSSDKNAEYYLIKYWREGSPQNFISVKTAQSPVTIRNLKNGEKYYFSVIAVNDEKKSVESSAVIAIPKRKHSFFKPKNGEMFVNAGRYLQKISVGDSSTNFTYGLSIPEKNNYTVWMKVMKGHTHFLYYRWYKLGEVEFNEGKNYFTLHAQTKDIQPGIFYFSNDKEKSPALMEEQFSEYDEMNFNIQNEKILYYR